MQHEIANNIKSIVEKKFTLHIKHTGETNQAYAQINALQMTIIKLVVALTSPFQMLGYHGVRAGSSCREYML